MNNILALIALALAGIATFAIISGSVPYFFAFGFLALVFANISNRNNGNKTRSI